MAGLVKILAVSLLPVLVHSTPYTPPLGINCTEISSKSASWIIRNFTVDTDTKFDFGPGTLGKVSFSIGNTANGYSFNCLQGSGATGRSPNHYLADGKVWYSCNVYCKGARGQPSEDDPPLDTSIHFEMKSKALSIRQTWSCGGLDRGALTNYTGTGASTISDLKCSQVPDGRPDQISCSPIDITVKASNVSIAEHSSNGVDGEPQDDPYSGDGSSPFLPPVYPKPGVLPSAQGCSKMSRSPSFEVSDFTWSADRVAFTLMNSALNYTQRCTIRGRLESPTWLNCTRFDSMHANYPPHGIYTTLRYGGPKNVLGVNQTWYCDDEDASNPTVYSAYGEVNFPLKCNETRSCVQPGPYAQTPEPERFIEDFCNADDLTITPSHINAFHISKENAIEDFRPHGYNCSSKSLEPPGKEAWEINGFTLTRIYSPEDPKLNISASNSYEIKFYYNNTATDNESPRNTGWRQCLYTSDDMEDELDGLKQLQCTMNFEPFTLGFKFDNRTSALTLNQGWTCDGVDSEHTNHFSAVGSGHIPLNCTSTGNNTQCRTGDRLRVPMVNITSQLNSNDTGDFSYPF
ncbi:hypothetical protein GQ53DRAFT_832046 [Thozetella sp. PMI_491]|nr:hypothetical protein GQ53DRAFT_832046 [Thozetella sp. PMI_491]